MKTEEREKIYRLVVRNLDGISDDEENTGLKAWIDESDENKKCYEQLVNIWQTKDSGHFDEIDSNRALESVLFKISGRPVLRRIWTLWGKAAAVIIFPVLIISALWLSGQKKKMISLSAPVYNEIFATFGTRTSLKLADGSQVWLNSGSSLRYPDKFIGETREVFLKGEAYFEVTTNHDMPFIVRSANLDVRATGTKFNVLDYSNDIKSEVTLISGKVFVSECDTNGTTKLLSELDPEQHMVFNERTKSFSINNEETYKYYSWKDGKLIFRNEPLSEVIKKIGQAFNVDIELRGADLQDYRYRATFEDESLSEILKLLEISSPIKYREIKREPFPDGSFPKKKIIIYPSNSNSDN